DRQRILDRRRVTEEVELTLDDVVDARWHWPVVHRNIGIAGYGPPIPAEVITIGDEDDLRQVKRRYLRPCVRDVHERLDRLGFIEVETDHRTSQYISI